MKIKSKIVLFALLGALLPAPANADPKGTVEIMSGEKSTVLDIKLAGELAPRLSFFYRGRTTADYEGTVSSFGLVDLTLDLGYGLGIFQETQAAPKTGLDPRAGASYQMQEGDFNAALLATVSLEDKNNLEFHPILSYRPQLSEDLRIVMRGENITRLSGENHLYSIQRIRLGLEVKGYQFGPAVDFSEKGSGSKCLFEYNVGGFVSKSF